MLGGRSHWHIVFVCDCLCSNFYRFYRFRRVSDSRRHLLSLSQGTLEFCRFIDWSGLVTVDDIFSSLCRQAVTKPGYAGGCHKCGPEAVTAPGYVYPGAATVTDVLGCHYLDVLACLCRPKMRSATFVVLYHVICQVGGSQTRL